MGVGELGLGVGLVVSLAAWLQGSASGSSH